MKGMEAKLLYPRLANNKIPVGVDQLVGALEHLARNYRIIGMDGAIGQESGSCNLLLALDSINHDPIKIIINSPGGVLDSAFMLYDTIKLIKSPVYTLARSACSAAVIVLAAGTKRYVMPHCRVMLHLPWANLQGNDAELDIQKKEVTKAKNEIVEILQACGVKKTAKEINKDIAREFWLGADETIAYGLADAVITPHDYQAWLEGGKND